MVRADVDQLPADTIVIEGGADGADAYARAAATRRLLHVATVPALWAGLGRPAGPRRNRAMMLLEPHYAFAYDLGGPGTRDMIALLKAAGVDVTVRVPL